MIIIKAKCVITPHHFVCKIFDTKKDMYDYYIDYIKKSVGNEKFPRFKRFSKKLNFEAICMPYEKYRYKNGKQLRAEDIGEILFYRDKIGAGITAHELGHAAMWWSRLVKKNFNAEFGPVVSNKEEDMLECLYNLVRTFTTECFKKKVY